MIYQTNGNGDGCGYGNGNGDGYGNGKSKSYVLTEVDLWLRVVTEYVEVS